jgi:hypothetical protein
MSRNTCPVLRIPLSLTRSVCPPSHGCPGCSCPGCSLLAVLFHHSCHGRPGLAVLSCRSPSSCRFAYLFCLSCSTYSVLSVHFCLSYSAWSVLPVRFRLSRTACPILSCLVLPAPFCLPCTVCPILDFPFWMHSNSPLWLSCPGCRVLTVHFWLSCPSYYGCYFWPSCPAVLFGCPFLTVLSCQSCPVNPPLAIQS